MADTGIARFSTCFGFTDREVMELYKKYLEHTKDVRFTFQELKIWYDRYRIANGQTVYNPHFVNWALSENNLGISFADESRYVDEDCLGADLGKSMYCCLRT